MRPGETPARDAVVLTQPHGAVGTEEDVPGLEVAVNAAAVVEEGQRFKQLLGNAADLRLRQPVVQFWTGRGGEQVDQYHHTIAP